MQHLSVYKIILWKSEIIDTETAKFVRYTEKRCGRIVIIEYMLYTRMPDKNVVKRKNKSI